MADAYVIDVKTGKRTPYRIVDLDTPPNATQCPHCHEWFDNDKDWPEVDAIDEWGKCGECAMIDDWLSRSQEAQDRAVLRGWG